MIASGCDGWQRRSYALRRTDRNGHRVRMVQGGMRRCVSDLWTMSMAGGSLGVVVPVPWRIVMPGAWWIGRRVAWTIGGIAYPTCVSRLWRIGTWTSGSGVSVPWRIVTWPVGVMGVSIPWRIVMIHGWLGCRSGFLCYVRSGSGHTLCWIRCHRVWSGRIMFALGSGRPAAWRIGLVFAAWMIGS